MSSSLSPWALMAAMLLAGCARANEPPPQNEPEPIPSVPVGAIPGHGSLSEDNSHKEGPRLLPAEVYIQMYLDVFGGLSPLEAEAASKATDATLFDHWTDYLASLGLPDYQRDVARVGQTNAIMIATFERIGVALCDKAVERDLRATPKLPVTKRTVFAFELTAIEPTDAEFAARFDVLHRTFLGYPAALAETPRLARFLDLYRKTVERHKTTPTAFSASEAGWAAVCHGLVRHPELHTY
jgi:hypothetical protein